MEVQPAAATSSNRYLPRGVAPRRDLIRFAATDRRVSNKKRKASLNKGGLLFQDLDREILRLVIAFGWLSKKQIAALLGCSVGSLQRRLRQLSAFGLLSDKSRGFGSEVLFSPTKLTLKHASMGDGFRISHPTPQTMNHTDGLVTTALRFMENANGIVVTEREIAAAVLTCALSGRIQALAPWAQAQFEGTSRNWMPASATVAGKDSGGHKRPDMLIIKQGTGQAPVAVEFELNQKSVSAYLRIVEAYDTAFAAGQISDTVFYVVAEVAGNASDIQTALKTALARALHDARPTPTHRANEQVIHETGKSK